MRASPVSICVRASGPSTAAADNDAAQQQVEARSGFTFILTQYNAKDSPTTLQIVNMIPRIEPSWLEPRQSIGPQSYLPQSFSFTVLSYPRAFALETGVQKTNHAVNG
ncbi:hypothetical protein G7054_g3140 [Neopestalotiopsis clavispora]|nr:hypothetical protein E8E14_013775 [Neopestalotiopsis sp. 37M]KAF7538156.1 hypothetical protein G7054_g3140 [Neopestalotiopsis clavispora]